MFETEIIAIEQKLMEQDRALLEKSNREKKRATKKQNDKKWIDKTIRTTKMQSKNTWCGNAWAVTYEDGEVDKTKLRKKWRK